MQGCEMFDNNETRYALMQVKTRNVQAHGAQKSKSEERRYRKMSNSCTLERSKTGFESPTTSLSRRLLTGLFYISKTGNVRQNLSAASLKLRNASWRMPRNCAQWILMVVRCHGILLATALDIADIVLLCCWNDEKWWSSQQTSYLRLPESCGHYAYVLLRGTYMLQVRKRCMFLESNVNACSERRL